MNGHPLLEARAVSVRFGGLVAVDQVSAAFAPGELVGIIGPNGAGKTTSSMRCRAWWRPPVASCTPRASA